MQMKMVAQCPGSSPISPRTQLSAMPWQADFYSSCLLMPRKLVFAAWNAAFPDRKPRVLQPRTAISHPYVEIRRRIDFRIGDIDCSEIDSEALDRIAKPFAETFVVSPIRCDDCDALGGTAGLTHRRRVPARLRGDSVEFRRRP